MGQESNYSAKRLLLNALNGLKGGAYALVREPIVHFGIKLYPPLGRRADYFERSLLSSEQAYFCAWEVPRRVQKCCEVIASSALTKTEST